MHAKCMQGVQQATDIAADLSCLLRLNALTHVAWGLQRDRCQISRLQLHMVLAK